MRTLEGKIALVTGGSRGIGRACAVALAGAGADSAVNDRENEDAARETCSLVEAAGRKAIPVPADVSRSSEVTDMFAAVEKGLGTVDILVNNAGIGRKYNWDQIPEEAWDEIVAVNLKSAYLVTQAALPGMRGKGWGRIINIASVAAATGGVIGPHYAASKAGLIGLTHGYASFLVKEGVTVNAVAPALILTDMTAHLKPDVIPLGRFGTPEEVAGAVVMLAENGFITGQTIHVNGGWYYT